MLAFVDIKYILIEKQVSRALRKSDAETSGCQCRSANQTSTDRAASQQLHLRLTQKHLTFELWSPSGALH